MVINSWLFWLHIFNTAGYLLLNISTIVGFYLHSQEIYGIEPRMKKISYSHTYIWLLQLYAVISFYKNIVLCKAM